MSMKTRTIKPGFFSNEHLGSLAPLTRLLFLGLWAEADRDGRLEDRPTRLKATILPYDDCDVHDLLQSLHAFNFIVRYEVNGCNYIQIVNFLKHQNPHPKEKSAGFPELPRNSVDSNLITRRAVKRCASPKRLKIRDNRSEIRSQEGGLGETNPQLELTPAEDSPPKRKREPLDISSLLLPNGMDSPSVREALQKWISYKRLRGESYKSVAPVTEIFNRAAKESWSPDDFCDAVSNSMACNYAGLFRPPRGSPSTTAGNGQYLNEAEKKQRFFKEMNAKLAGESTDEKHGNATIIEADFKRSTPGESH